MASKPKYEAFVSPVGTAIFPYLINPDTRFNADGVFVTDISVPKELAAPFVERLEASLEKFFKEELNSNQQQTLARKTVFTPEFTRPTYPEGATDDEKAAMREAHVAEETGNVLFRVKMNAKFTSGKGEIVTQTPIVVSADTGERITENVWTGSTVRVKGQIVPYVNAAAQVAGLSLRMKAVQVIDLVSGSGGASGYWTDFEIDDAS